MRTLPLKFACAALLVALLAFARWGTPALEIASHDTAGGIAGVAEQLNIRNLVSAIYLGPRAVDTFLEVMVVTLAVVGMKFAREDRR